MNIPRKPTYIMPKNFRYSGNVSVAINSINELLHNDSSLISEFNGAKWYITFNSTCTKCEVNIFRDDDDFIFECNKLIGPDSVSFLNLFNRISNAVIGTTHNEISFAPPPVPEHLRIPITEDQILCTLAHVSELIKSENEFNRNMGRQILHEMSCDEELRPYLHRCTSDIYF